MFGLFKKKSASTTINAIKIPDFGWKLEENNKDLKLWINDDQTMALSVNHFSTPPDLPTIKNIDVLRDFYRTNLASQNGGLILVESIVLGKIKAIKTIFKIPMEPTGMQYLASITIPFKNSSFVVKIQAPETGTTGIRESMVANKLLSSGEVKLSDDKIENWAADPYSSEIEGKTLMNQSELELYDKDFALHPLSVARKLINQIQHEMKFDTSLESMPPFSK